MFDLFNKSPNLNLDMFLQIYLYDKIVMPVTLYGSEVWDHMGRSNELHVSQPIPRHKCAERGSTWSLRMHLAHRRSDADNQGSTRKQR